MGTGAAKAGGQAAAGRHRQEPGRTRPSTCQMPARLGVLPVLAVALSTSPRTTSGWSRAISCAIAPPIE